MKTQQFTLLLIGWDIRNQHILHSKIIKKHAYNPNMCFDASSDRHYQKVIQNGLQRRTQTPSKIIKIHPGTFQGPSECICDALDCKIVPKWCPRTSEWSQNVHPRTLTGKDYPSVTLTRCFFWFGFVGFRFLGLDSCFGIPCFAFIVLTLLFWTP